MCGNGGGGNGPASCPTVGAGRSSEHTPHHHRHRHTHRHHRLTHLTHHTQREMEVVVEVVSEVGECAVTVAVAMMGQFM